MRKTGLDSLDLIAAAVFALDVDEHGEPVFSAYNRYAEILTGFSADHVLGKTAKEVLPGRSGQIAYAHHIDLIKSGETRNYEIRFTRGTEPRLIRTTLQAVKDNRGHVIKLIGTSVDITHEEVEREVQATVTTITNEMEDFITMAAHDLRTPMRNVHNIADMLRDGFEDLGDGKLGLIDLLEDVALKATSLISDVLAHAQATKAKEEIVTFDFEELCSELCDILDPLGGHKIKSANGHIHGDKTAFQIVIRNLLDNAFKHGGRDQLRLSIELSDLDNAMIEVLVRDNGQGFENPGIAFLESGKLRADSGFGLFGIRRLVQSRGGQISAETPEIGRGSLIRFTLPGRFATGQKQQSPQIVATTL